MPDIGCPLAIGERRTWRAYLRTPVAVAATAVLCLASPAAAKAGQATLRATKTAVVASAYRSSYDSVVRFSAHVTSAGRTPAGSVTFIDQVNGGILDSVALSNGRAAFSTAALAPGTRKIIAVYDGTPAFARSRSSAARISVRGVDDAIANQIDTRHDGYQGADALRVGSLTKKWSVSISGVSGDLTYPIIADHRIFVSGSDSSDPESTVYALSQRDGHIDWSARVRSTYFLAGLAYDGGTLFCLNSDGVLTAFNATTGNERWAVRMPAQYHFTGAPAAYDGVVYLAGAGIGGTVYAVSEADGIVTWSRSVENGDDSSPAVDGRALYLSYACQQDYRFSLAGRLVWHHSTYCEGGGGSTPADHGNLVYAEGFGDPPLILSAGTGKTAGSFAAGSIPAFGNENMYTLRSGNLVAVDPSGGPDRWARGGGMLVTPPVADNGLVFAGASNGKVYGFSPAGRQIWAGVAGQGIGSDAYSGLAIGNRMLVVPAGHVITAFRD